MAFGRTRAGDRAGGPGPGRDRLGRVRNPDRRWFLIWLGSQRPIHDEGQQASGAVPSATIAVPQPRPPRPQKSRLRPQPQVAPVAQPQVRVVRVPELRVVPLPAQARPKAMPNPGPQPGPLLRTRSRRCRGSVAAESPAPVALKPWPARVVAGASGRLVQIGAYGSRLQAKRGWLRWRANIRR